MKNKRFDQIAAKQRHRKQMKAERRNEPSLERPVAALMEKPSILIVCEGENTEPSYFNQFRLSSATVKSVGEGYNTISLINRAYSFHKKGILTRSGAFLTRMILVKATLTMRYK